MSQFGQKVELTVHNKGRNKTIFTSGGLRVDFDVRQIDGFNRATFSIWNLDDTTIGRLSADGNYVTVVTQLHGNREFTVANSFYVSNVMTESILPNRITTLYCVDTLRRNILETPINETVADPTLKRIMEKTCRAAEFTGKIVYKSFPEGKIDQTSGRKFSVHAGSLQSCIRELQKQHKFSFYTDEGNFVLMFKPNLKQVGTTDLPTKRPDVLLNALNLRDNPKFGPATLNITSNLDGRIKPSAFLDTSELITAGTSTDEQVLQLADRFLRDSIAGFTKYQALAVQHKGSNFTKMWHTIVTATSPTVGRPMPTVRWFT